MRCLLATTAGIGLLVATSQVLATRVQGQEVIDFSPFYYRTHVDESDPAHPVYTHRYLISDHLQRITLKDGRQMGLWISLYLFPDHKYLMVYQENFFNEDEDGGFTTGECRKLKGEWEIQGPNLVLPSILKAQKRVERNRTYLKATFIKDLFTQGIKRQTIDLDTTFSNLGPDQDRCW